jgi:hypothetical protein
MKMSEVIALMRADLATHGDLDVYAYNDEMGDYYDIDAPSVLNVGGRGSHAKHGYVMQ